ncbi:MAG TPA: DUF6544 family protein [Mycobacteriales bacterium]|jgi:hypothetical protein
MTTVPAPARTVSRDWESLIPDHAPDQVFVPEMVSTLPETAQRLLRHAIEPGVPLWRSVDLQMHGEIRLGGWRRFTARQVLTPGVGFIWAATARVFGLPVSGYDRYSAGTGEMRWRLASVLPVVTASGRDVTRSAAGRLAAEAIFVPTTFDRATWADGATPDIARRTSRVGDNEDVVDLHVGADGTLQAVTMQRWGQAGKAPAQLRTFGVSMLAEHRVSGLAIPVRFTGWWDAPGDGDFFRAQITATTFH